MAVNYSNCDLIPQSQVIAAAKMKLQLVNTDYDLWFEVELDHALRKFNSPGTLHPIIKKVEVCENKFKVPKGMHNLTGISIYYGDSDAIDEDHGQTTQPPWIPFIVYTQGYPFFATASNAYLESIVTLSNGYGHLNAWCDDDLEITCCLISYIGWKTDDKGIFYIYANYENCLASFLCYNFLLSNPYFHADPYVTRDLRMEHYNTYLAEKRLIKGDEKQTEFDQQRLALALTLDRVKIHDFISYPFYGV